MKDQELDVVEASLPSETEEEPTSSVSVRGAINVEAPATRESSAPPLEKKNSG
jgi:hypothetical protein